MTTAELIEQFKHLFDSLSLEDKRKLLKDLMSIGSPSIVPLDKLDLSTELSTDS